MGQARKRGTLEERTAQAIRAQEERAAASERERERLRREYERLPDEVRERFERKERDRTAALALILGSLPRPFIRR